MTKRCALVGAAVLALSCGPKTETEKPRAAELDGVKLTSSAEKKSHFAGQNCMTCHSANGNGPGLFQVAGTLYTSQGAINPGGTIELRSAPRQGGELIVSLQADLDGNFYSTDAVGLENVRRFVVVKGARETVEMPFPTESGACNLCHSPSLRVRAD
jgi:hypothetical protein